MVQIKIVSTIMLAITVNLLRIVNKDCISLTRVFCLIPSFAYNG